jgi:hypothetical protein
MYISAHKDRVTVIFSTLFSDEDDVVFGRLFLQEFAEARARNQAAPQVLYVVSLCFSCWDAECKQHLCVGEGVRLFECRIVGG